MQRRKKVYIPNKGGHDYSSAARFGDLVYITEGTVNKFALDVFYRRAAEVMKDAERDDYIMIASLNSICCIAAAIMARRFGRLNLLLYRRDRYIERIIDVDSLLFHTPTEIQDDEDI